MRLSKTEVSLPKERELKGWELKHKGQQRIEMGTMKQKPGASNGADSNRL